MKKLKNTLLCLSLSLVSMLQIGCGLNPDKIHDGLVCGIMGARCPMTQDDVKRLEASIAALELYIEQMRSEVAADLSGVWDALNQVVTATSSSVAEIIDPGQPGGEVIFRMSNGQFVAWYKDVGLYSLVPDTVYQTTDSEKQKFSIVNGEYTEL